MPFMINPNIWKALTELPEAYGRLQADSTMLESSQRSLEAGSRAIARHDLMDG